MNISLDSSLRILYDSIRYKKGCSLMAIEFEHNGKTWRADTVKEAIELREQLEAIERGEAPRRKSVWDVEKFTDAVNALGKLQHKLLFRVYESEGATSADLVVVLGLTSEIALAGVISGLSKQVRQHGLELKDVLRIDVKWHGKTKERRFNLTGDFKAVAESVGWPEPWRLKIDMDALQALDETKGEGPQ
jgi:hypothetical protein